MMELSKPNMKSVTFQEAVVENRYNPFVKIEIKMDGTLMYYNGEHLFSDRDVMREGRFPHVFETLKKYGFPNCKGEMFIPREALGRRTNVFDVSSKENWLKASYMIFDSDNPELTAKLIEQANKEGNFDVEKPTTFNSLDEGYIFTMENQEEGLVLTAKSGQQYKLKHQIEIKEEISKHEAGSVKGTFILASGNRISGTSEDYVRQFHRLKNEGKIPFAEIEMSFLTANNHYFQPKLRRIGTAQELEVA